MVKYSKEMDWKAHSVDLEAFEAWAKANCGEHYCGNSADSKLRMHFLEEPSQEIKDAIDAQWEAMDDEAHAMCASYESQAERQAAKAAAKAAAMQALATASGLSPQQIQALLS